MTFAKLLNRAVLGLQGNDIRQKALEYLYEAEADMCLKAKCYEKNNLNLMVDPDNLNIVNLPSDFLEFSALPEWKSIPLDYNPKWRSDVLRKADGTWYTGTPEEYFMQNKDLYLYPQPSAYTGDYKLAAWFVAKAPDFHASVAEVTKITCYDASTLDGGEYFYISTTTTDYYVWFDLDNGSTDPSASGRTGVEIDVTTGDVASTIAAALGVALNALSGYTATSSGSAVTVTNGSAGAVTNIPVDVDSGVVINVTTDGQDTVSSPVFGSEYHIYLYDYARWLLLIDDGDIKRGDYHHQLYLQNREEVKKHFKSRISPNISRIVRDGSGGPISGAFPGNRPRGNRSYVVHSETATSTTTTSSSVTTTVTTDDTVTTLETTVIPTGTNKQIELHVSAQNADGSKTGSWTYTKSFQNISGTVAATSAGVWNARTRNDSGWDPSFVISGSSVLAQVQVGASENITWSSRTVVT